MTIKPLPVLLLLTFLSLFVGSTSGDLIQNGSFEDGGSIPSDWVVSGNMGTTTLQGETDGLRALAFSIGNVPSNGVLSQTFNTTAGEEYRLSFDFGKYAINQPNQIARLEVGVFDGTGFTGTQILDEIVIDDSPGPGDPNSTDSPDVYSSFEFSFNAANSLTTLRFTDVSDAQVSGGGFDAMLDNVVVTAIPEPSSAFTLISIGLLLVHLRRKKLVEQKRFVAPTEI